MKPRSDRRYGFLLLVGLGLTLTAQVLVYLSTLDMTIGAAPLFGRQSETPATPYLELKVAILRSEMSSQIEGQDPIFYFDLARKWQALLTNAGIDNEVISDQQLEAGLDIAFNVLVLPQAVCLSQTQREVIVGSLEAGMGVVAGGPIGARNAQCEWVGLDFTAELAGLKSAEAAAIGPDGFAVIRGGRFYSNSARTGYNLPLPPQEIVVGSALDPDWYWSDRMTRPAKGKVTEGSALATHGVRGNGRFVWFGFREALPETTASDHQTLDGYLTAAVQWVGRQPVAVLEDWPARNTGAVVMAQNVQDNGVSVRAAVSLLTENRVPATFFMTPATAAANAQALAETDDLIEIAVTGPDSQPLNGLPAETQADRLAQLTAGIEQALPGRPIRGFRPPQELTDAGTIQSIENAELSYFYDSVAASHGTPTRFGGEAEDWLSVVGPKLTRISRPGQDDFEALVNFTGENTAGDEFVKHLLTDYARTVNLGGVYTLLFHNDLLGAPNNLPVLERVIRHIREGRVWMTSAAGLAEWRSTRSQVSVESRFVSPSRIRLAVTNRGANALSEATVNLHLPFRPESVRMIPGMLRSGLPETHLADDSDMLSLEFPLIKPQSSHVLLIALDEER